MRSLKRSGFVALVAMAAVVALSAFPPINASIVPAPAGYAGAAAPVSTVTPSRVDRTPADSAVVASTTGAGTTVAAATTASPRPPDPAPRDSSRSYRHEKVTFAADDRAIVTNPASREVVVNKERALPDGYAPADLVYPDVPFSFKEKLEKRMLRREAAEALERLFAAGAREGIRLVGISGYRSYATQQAIFARQVRTRGEAEAARVSAYPGRSEHQTGLAIDVSSASVGYALSAGFGRSREGRWLAVNAHRFGFIIRYPDGREAMTGYIYEPWHIRYVGTELAAQITASGNTLDEFFAAPVPVKRIAEAGL